MRDCREDRPTAQTEVRTNSRLACLWSSPDTPTSTRPKTRSGTAQPDFRFEKGIGPNRPGNARRPERAVEREQRNSPAAAGQAPEGPRPATSPPGATSDTATPNVPLGRAVPHHGWRSDDTAPTSRSPRRRRPRRTRPPCREISKQPVPSRQTKVLDDHAVSPCTGSPVRLHRSLRLRGTCIVTCPRHRRS